jgi:hypothetical protein
MRFTHFDMRFSAGITMNDEKKPITIATPTPIPTPTPPIAPSLTTPTPTPTPTPSIKVPKAATGSVRHHLELIAQDQDASTLEVPIRPEEACAILACMYAARETMGTLTEVKAQLVRDALALLEE